MLFGVARRRDPVWRWLRLAVMAVALATGIPAASAAGWPERTVRLVTTSGAGGGPDSVARALAEGLSRRWGQPVLVENRPGADGILAVRALLSANDGHTLLLAFTGIVTVNPSMHADLPYDPARDLLPISYVVDDFQCIVVAPALADQSLDDLVKLARSKPDELTYASLPGAPDLAFRALQKRADISMRLVPYRNPLGAIPDLMANRIHVAVLSLTTVLELARDEKLKLLAVGARARARAYPELPTAIEMGYPDFLLEGGLGLFGPRSMPFDQRLHLAADVRAALREVDTARKLGNIGYAIRATDPTELGTLLDEQSAKWSSVARELGVRPQPGKPP
jgi:tripartite-type tricarboxylate transporter receptor subunit TctC